MELEKKLLFALLIISDAYLSGSLRDLHTHRAETRESGAPAGPTDPRAANLASDGRWSQCWKQPNAVEKHRAGDHHTVARCDGSGSPHCCSQVVKLHSPIPVPVQLLEEALSCECRRSPYR